MSLDFYREPIDLSDPASQARLGEICARYHVDRRLGAPAVVFNHVPNRQEA